MRMYMAVALVVLAVGGCSKNDVTGGGGTLVAAGGNFINASFAPTVLKCDLLLDGTVIATQTYATATGGCAPIIGTAWIQNGSHTLAFRITSQSSSPNSYKAFGVSVGGGGTSENLADRTQTLATGQSISYTITWP